MQILSSSDIPELPEDQRCLLNELACQVTEARPVGGPVQVILTDDVYMRELNATYRGKDQPTDVLSFDLEASAPDLPGVDKISGEIYISVERAEIQAAEQQTPLITEMARLLVHGLLHLAGYDHDTPERLRFMEQETDRFLQAIDLLSVPRA